MKRLISPLLLVSMVAMACSPGTASLPSTAGEAVPTPNAVVDDTPRPSSTPTTALATAAPTVAPTPEPSASVSKVREFIKACSTSGFVQATIIVELINEGTGWAELSGGDYTVYDEAEDVVGTGSFTYSYPKYLAPGATGYLLESGYFEDVKAGDVKRVEADGRYDGVDAADIIELKAAKVKVKRESYGDGLYTTGTITNTSDTDVRSAHVGSVFLDAKGRAIGFASTNLIENLGAGKTKGFETLTQGCAVKKSSIDKTVTIASDDNF